MASQGTGCIVYFDKFQRLIALVIISLYVTTERRLETVVAEATVRYQLAASIRGGDQVRGSS